RDVGDPAPDPAALPGDAQQVDAVAGTQAELARGPAREPAARPYDRLRHQDIVLPRKKAFAQLARTRRFQVSRGEERAQVLRVDLDHEHVLRQEALLGRRDHPPLVAHEADHVQAGRELRDDLRQPAADPLAVPRDPYLAEVFLDLEQLLRTRLPA